ncbi:MAG: PA0069 family radical SAM protein [Nitrospirales bacterium]|nr:PA0069 family radical SAM protein [Nitrospirales bacterium]
MKPVANPPNPFSSEHRELLIPSPPVQTSVFEETTNQILSRNNSPDLPFRWSINPYRGCFYGCAYCYARATHEYWGFGAGTDFESQLIVKPNASAQLQKAFERPSWKGELVVFSGNTDCYQPLEASCRVTRACLHVCAEFRNPVGIITKSGLILRDLDVLQTLHERAWVQVYISIPFADDETARKVEPYVPSITKRFEIITKLAQAGIVVNVSIAPIIPGLNEQDIPKILRRARDAGASGATYVLLRLHGSVETVFMDRMSRAFPDRIHKIKNRLQVLRSGNVSEKTFFKRHHGQGLPWQMIEQLFDVHYRKAGYHEEPDLPVRQTFQRPGPLQTSLF